MIDSATRFHDAYESQMVRAQVGVLNKPLADELLFGITAAANDNEIQHGILPERPFGAVRSKEDVLSGSLIYKKDSVANTALKVRLYGELAEVRAQQIDTFSNSYNWFGEVVLRQDQTQGERGGAKTLFTFNDRRQVLNFSANYEVWEDHKIAFNYTKNHLKREGNDPFTYG